MPAVLIGADGCPVVDLTTRLCKGHKVAVLITHRIQREGAEALVFGKGADSVDFALVNRNRSIIPQLPKGGRMWDNRRKRDK